MGLRLRQLYPAGDPNIVAQKVSPKRIVAMVDDLTKGFGGDVGVVQMRFLRRLVNQFDAVAENPEDSIRPPPATLEEQRASEGKKLYDYEPDPDDDKGYPVTSVEFQAVTAFARFPPRLQEPTTPHQHANQSNNGSSKRAATHARRQLCLGPIPHR